MAVYLIFQCALSYLIESGKIERNPATVGKYQAMEADYQPLLVNARTEVAVPMTLEPRGTRIRCRSAE